jgi:hypothetical protein
MPVVSSNKTPYLVSDRRPTSAANQEPSAPAALKRVPKCPITKERNHHAAEAARWLRNLYCAVAIFTMIIVLPTVISCVVFVQMGALPSWSSIGPISPVALGWWCLVVRRCWNQYQQALKKRDLWALTLAAPASARSPHPESHCIGDHQPRFSRPFTEPALGSTPRTFTHENWNTVELCRCRAGATSPAKKNGRGARPRNFSEPTTPKPAGTIPKVTPIRLIKKTASIC